MEEMEAQLGYCIEYHDEALGQDTLLYSDLTPFVGDLTRRTTREYEMFEKGVKRCEGATVIRANCDTRVWDRHLHNRLC